MRLHQIPFSTNVERVALALAFKGLGAEPVAVDPADRSAVLALSGQGLVPVLEDGDRVIADSTAIIEYLERRFPDPPLFPADPARRAELELFVDWFNRVWKRPPNLLADELRRPLPDDARIAALSAETFASLDRFEALLDRRDHLMGEFSAADCAVFPFLRYPVLGRDPDDDDPFHIALVEHLPFDKGRHPRIADWVRRVDGRPRAGLLPVA